MKRILPFFIILSLTFPLFSILFLHFCPIFAFASDSDSVSSDQAYINWTKDNVDNIRNQLAENGLVIDNEFYDNSNNNDDSLWSIGANFWGIDITQTSGHPLSRVVYDYCVENNINFEDCFNTVYNYASSCVPYYIYHSMPISDFFSYFVFSSPDSDGLRELQNFRNWVIPCVNNLEGLSSLYCNYYIWAHDTFITNYGSLTDDYNFCLSSGTFSVFPDLEYQTFVGNDPNNANFPSPFSGTLNLYSDENYSQYDGQFTQYRGYSGNVSSNSTLSSAYVGFIQNGNYASWHCFAQGCLFVTPDSLGSISFPVFKSSADMQLFYTGRSSVYSFDPSLDINSYGSDLDLSELYDVIRNSISDSEGDIINTINRVANNYLSEQVELLGDIRNALNDSFGRSWLRRIYNLLDDRLDNKISDVIEAIENISISGGSSGSGPNYSDSLDNINSQLTNIQGYLLFLSAEELLDNIRSDPTFSADISDVTLLMQTKFPFCIPTDVLTILGLFNADPVEPEFYVPIPLTDNEKFLIDLSFYEQIRPVVEAFLIISFIIMLSVLSAKIIKVIRGV